MVEPVCYNIEIVEIMITIWSRTRLSETYVSVGM